MTLENSYQQLVEQLDSTRVALEELRLLSLEDHPQAGASAVIGDLGDESAVLIGLLNEALDSALAGQRQLALGDDIGAVMLELVACQAKFSLGGYTLQNGLRSYRKLRKLRRVGLENQGEWLEWTRCIHKEVDRCQQRMQEADRALLQCWQEFAERLRYRRSAALKREHFTG